MWRDDRPIAGPRRRADAGATLLELLVAITIAAMMVSGAAAVFGPPVADARAAAALVAQALRDARAEAAASRAPVAVRFDLPGRAVRVGDGPPRPAPPAVRWTLDTARQAAGADGLPAIVFFPEGGATGGRIALHDATDGAAAATVSVRWLTGAIRVD